MVTAPFWDIHCHILPGVDDGPHTLEQSIAMAKAFVAGGVRHVFATPHHIAGTAWTLSIDQLHQRIDRLQSVFQAHNIPLTLHPGMEIALHYHLADELSNNTLLALGNSNCYLLEAPFQLFRNDLLDIVIAFKNGGKDVILAHPERIPFFQKNISSLDRLINQNIMTQVNIASLLGQFGKKAKNTALYLAENNRIHFVASDSHGPDTRRPPTEKEWLKLEQILGPEGIQSTCIDNPARLLGNEYFTDDQDSNLN